MKIQQSYDLLKMEDSRYMFSQRAGHPIPDLTSFFTSYIPLISQDATHHHHELQTFLSFLRTGTSQKEKKVSSWSSFCPKKSHDTTPIPSTERESFFVEVTFSICVSYGMFPLFVISCEKEEANRERKKERTNWNGKPKIKRRKWAVVALSGK